MSYPNTWRDRNALNTAVLLSVRLCALLHWLAIRGTEGRYIYPLDDTYIGMTMAKTLAQHGTWGINRGEFASATSSPGFVLVPAALYRITGVFAAGLKAHRPVAIIIPVSILLHLQFGQLHWFYRFEAYLVSLCVVGPCFCLVVARPRKWVSAGVVLNDK